VFLPYVLVSPGDAGHGLLVAIVRGYDREFKPISTAALMTFA
jgi:hypothetical protein